jgi:AcrR family transcriptional regulator
MTPPAESAGSRVPRTRKRLGRAARRTAILDAAASTFAVGGYAGTSIADIARAAGVSHLIVYRHFTSKGELYEAVLERAMEALVSALAVDGAAGTYGPTPETLLAAARTDEDAFRVLWRHAAREPEFAGHADAARERVLEITAAALEAIMAPEHLHWAARATITYVVDAVLVWVEDGDERLDDRFVAATTAALRAGVRSWSKPTSLREKAR